MVPVRGGRVKDLPGVRLPDHPRVSWSRRASPANLQAGPQPLRREGGEANATQGPWLLKRPLVNDPVSRVAAGHQLTSTRFVGSARSRWPIASVWWRSPERAREDRAPIRSSPLKRAMDSAKPASRSVAGASVAPIPTQVPVPEVRRTARGHARLALAGELLQARRDETMVGSWPARSPTPAMAWGAAVKRRGTHSQRWLEANRRPSRTTGW